MNKQDDIKELKEYLDNLWDENPLFFAILLLVGLAMSTKKRLKEEKGKEKDEK